MNKNISRNVLKIQFGFEIPADTRVGGAEERSRSVNPAHHACVWGPLVAVGPRAAASFA